jgi:hypothetical protein
MGTVYEYRNWNTGDSGSDSSNSYDTSIAVQHKVYRGNDLGTVSADNIDSFIEEHGITTGKFTDLYVGDYFTAKYPVYNGTYLYTVNFIIMDIDPYWGIHESGIGDKHHILITSNLGLDSSKMTTNPSTSTNKEGYLTTYAFSTVIPTIDTNLSAIFGDHLLSYNEIVSYNNTTGICMVSVKSILMNEIEVYGKTYYSDNPSGLLNYQLPGFAQNSDLIPLFDDEGAYPSWYLRDNSGYSFCYVLYDGSAQVKNYTKNSEHMRPRFLLG